MNKSRTKLTPESIRESILDALTRAGTNHMKTNELSKKLGIRATDPEYDMVRTALQLLEDEGLIFRGPRRRYGRTVPVVVVEGRLESSRDGWRVIPDDDPTGGLEIEPRDLWTAFHGDRVRAKMIAPALAGERPRGEVTRVIERTTTSIVGTLKQGRGYYLEPDNRKMHRTITIPRRQLGEARVGDKVMVRLYDWNDPSEDPQGHVEKVLGRAGEMNAEIASIAAAHRLRHEFPHQVEQEAAAFGDTLTKEDLAGRRDLRDTTIITIDPADARDFDDAISIEEHDDGDVTLGIHIADVGHYVGEGSELDAEAQRRGTSVYLVTGVIPMLPERLSNNLCSLRPHEDRLAYSVLARLSPKGVVKEYEIVKSVINSKRRFTYEEALAVLQTGEGDFAHELLAINRMAHVLRSLRRRKGSVEFDRPEMKFILDDRNHPIAVVQKHATESTKLIEDCMLLANRIVAGHVSKMRGSNRQGAGDPDARGGRAPFIYRIHDVPPKEKIIELAAFVKALGYTLPVDNVQPKDLQALLDSARGTEEEELINDMTLRSMAKAVYSEFNIGHFGLAFAHYTHFTSPIRRYPDLIVHRMLFEYERGMNGPRRQWYAAHLGSLADHCSERERAAVEAERDSVKIAQVEFLKDHLGDVFEATISGVMPFGMFARLHRFGIEGLVRVRSMTEDYFQYDERSRAFHGVRSKVRYRLGDMIHVRVVRIDDMRSEIDLELIDREEYDAEANEPIGADGRGAKPTTLADLLTKPIRRPAPSRAVQTARRARHEVDAQARSLVDEGLDSGTARRLARKGTEETAKPSGGRRSHTAPSRRSRPASEESGPTKPAPIEARPSKRSPATAPSSKAPAAKAPAAKARAAKAPAAKAPAAKTSAAKAPAAKAPAAKAPAAKTSSAKAAPAKAASSKRSSSKAPAVGGAPAGKRKAAPARGAGAQKRRRA